jgi:hypothetical protein
VRQGAEILKRAIPCISSAFRVENDHPERIFEASVAIREDRERPPGINEPLVPLPWECELVKRI